MNVIPSQQFQSQIQTLMNQGNWSQAWAVAKVFIEAHPKLLVAWVLYSQVAVHNRRWPDAQKGLKNALSISPEDWMLMWQLIKVYESSLCFEQAVPLAVKMSSLCLQANQTSLKPQQKALMAQLAHFLLTHHQFEQAEKIHAALSAGGAKKPEWQLTWARLKQFLGDLSGAKDLVESLLEKSPHNPECLYFLAHLKNQKPWLLEQIEQAISMQNLPAEQLAKLYYSQAKLLEDQGSYAASFKARIQGAALFRRSFQYQPEGELAFLDAIKHQYSEQVVNDTAEAASSDSPIFIVGLPRSGTTLLERMLANHEEVTAAGELIYFGRLMNAAVEQLPDARNKTQSEMVALSTQLDFASLGHAYLASANATLQEPKRFIDKHPINAQYLGMIHKALPQAKFLILDRDAMDVCYAVYKQLFAVGIYQYSYDLNEMAAYFQKHQTLMDHWQQVMPDAVYRVQYEDLVSNSEAEIRKVLSFCGLSWQAACLDIGSNRQATATASSSQVRQGIYTSSVGLWKNYSQQLQPLKQGLQNQSTQ